jgi:hypothetical protein
MPAKGDDFGLARHDRGGREEEICAVTLLLHVNVTAPNGTCSLRALQASGTFSSTTAAASIQQLALGQKIPSQTQVL